MGYVVPLPPRPVAPREVECYGCGAPLDRERCDYCGRRASRASDKPPRDIMPYYLARPTPQGDWECEPGFAERFLERISRGKAKAINLSGRARGPRPPAGNDVEWK